MQLTNDKSEKRRIRRTRTEICHSIPHENMHRFDT